MKVLNNLPKPTNEMNSETNDNFDDLFKWEPKRKPLTRWAIQISARSTDPDTSHEAAKEFESNQDKAQRSVATVVLIMKENGSLTDFELLKFWPNYWGNLFSESLPRKARGWARAAGLVMLDGEGLNNGRRVKKWGLGVDAKFIESQQKVKCPCCQTLVSRSELKHENS
jgi:hypothetical protein